VANAEQSFAESWRLAGGRPEDIAIPNDDTRRGDVSLRLIPTEPFTGNLLRLDMLVTALARRSLWLTDAYFIGTGAYIEALRRAAQDGVDVRLLVPQYSDVGWTVPAARSLYRPLLEAGVRIFEWNGTMVHSKTAIADSRWARIGSTNLNVNSWLGNWELDVALEDHGVAATLEAHYLADLERSTEIVLQTHRLPTRFSVAAAPRHATRGYRSSRRVVQTVTGVGRSLGAAVTGNRRLEDFEAGPVLATAFALMAMAAVAFFAPRALAWPFAVLAFWTAITFVAEAWKLWRRKP
jgi:phosphatidylserine/phosphatidylglycerophosphate/cardiolipin synthase-like enzyme